MRSLRTPLWAAACAALLVAAPAALATPVLSGTTATAVASGPATALLGADGGYAPGAGSGTTAVTDVAFTPEYISDDFAIVVDIATDGALLFTDNTGTGGWAGRYEIDFSFTGGALPFSAFAFNDLAALAAGTVTASLLSPSSLRVVFDGVQLSAPYLSLGARVSAAAPVSAPGTLGLAGLALLLAAAGRRPAGLRKEAA